MTPAQTKISLPTSFLLASTLCAALTACGGGGDSTPAATTTPTTPAAASFAGCFEITEGVAYTVTDPGGVPDGVRMAKETFEGAVRNAAVEFTDATTVRSNATYWSQDANGTRLLGGILYDANGNAIAKAVRSDGFTLPLTMQAGDSKTLNYTEVTTVLAGASAGHTETASAQETWTFEGYETVTLAGKTFTDACRVKTLDADAAANGDGPSTLWFAKGFGIIRAVHTNSAGATVEDIKVETITAQP